MENEYLKTGYDEIDSFAGGYKRGRLTAVTSCVDVVATISSLTLLYKALEEGNGPIALFSTDLDYKTLISVITAPSKSLFIEGPSLEELEKGFIPKKDKIYVFAARHDLPYISYMGLALRKCKPSFPVIFISSLDAISEASSPLTKDEDERKAIIMKSLKNLAALGNNAVVIQVSFSCNNKIGSGESLFIEQVGRIALLQKNVDLVLSVYDKKACQAVKKGIAKPLEMLSTQLLFSDDKQRQNYLKEIKILVWRNGRETKEVNFAE